MLTTAKKCTAASALSDCYYCDTDAISAVKVDDDYYYDRFATKSDFTNLQNAINNFDKRKFCTIKSFRVLAPNKVIEVLFDDNKKEKIICHEEDKFDLRDGLFIATAKHLYKDEYTYEGIEVKTAELKLKKDFVKMVDNAIKQYEKEQRAKAERKAKEEKEKEIAKKQREKRLAKINKRKAAKREAEIEMRKEAYLRAMKEVFGSKDVISEELTLEESDGELELENVE